MSVYALCVSLLGYALLALSAVAVTLLVGLTTGYYPCATCFTLPLLTFRLTEIHWAFVLIPIAGRLLCHGPPVQDWGEQKDSLWAGLGLSSPYLLVALVYALMGAGEFPLEIAILWVAWAFVVGVASSIAVDRLRVG